MANRRSTGGKAGTGRAPKGGGRPTTVARAGRGGARPQGAAGCDAWLESGALAPGATYLQGQDEALKAEVLERFKDAWMRVAPDSPPQVFRAGEAGPGVILGAVQGGSLFATRSLAIVVRVEDWTRSTATPTAVAQALPLVPEENAIVFVESAGTTERKNLEPLRAACARIFTLDGLSAAELERWAKRRAERQGLKLDEDAWRAVFTLSRLETGEVLNELDKLAAWAGKSGRVSGSDALRLLRPVAGTTLETLAAAVAERRSDLAMDSLLRALEGGESAGSILFQLETLLAGGLRLVGRSRGWVRDRVLSQRVAERWTRSQMTAGLDLLYRCERAWKTGRAPEDILLVRAVQGLTA